MALAQNRANGRHTTNKKIRFQDVSIRDTRSAIR
jgi:hypothetical protein